MDAVSAASSIAVARIQVPVLSVQQLLQCSYNSGGCAGDFPTNSLDYAVQNALLPDSAVPGTNLSCANLSQTLTPPQTVMYEAVSFRSWFGLLLTVQVLPAIVVIDGTSDAFQGATINCMIQGFVFSDPSCNTGALSHSVLVVGFDLLALTPYWIIRNSWGMDWCDGGYMRLAIQGGDGVCAMHKLPAYYPIAAPRTGDPCYTKSTRPGGFRYPVLNPCGDGLCTPEPLWGPYGYRCNCSDLGEDDRQDFVAVNNTVKVSLPGAVLGITQACVPVDVCGMGMNNPCEVGTCVNDGQGSYTCICPLGYYQTVYADNRGPLCKFGTSDLPEYAMYYTQPGASTLQIAAAYQLTIDQLQAQNPAVNISQEPLPLNTPLDVSNPFYSCQVAYTVPMEEKTCDDVARKLKPLNTDVVGADGATLQAYNPGTDCSKLIRGQLLCLSPGQWTPAPPCIRYYPMTEKDSCQNVTDMYFPSDPLPFYAYNPGILCGSVALTGLGTAPRLGAQGREVCVAVGSEIGTVNCKARGNVLKISLTQYVMRKSEKCADLLKKSRKPPLNFASINQIECINKPFGFKCATARANQIICRPAAVTTCKLKPAACRAACLQ